MYTGLSNSKELDHPTPRMIESEGKKDRCCATEEPAVETIEIPTASQHADWQEEQPPYYHREIF